MVRLLICGGGNGAHVLAGIAASDPDIEVRVLTLFSDEAVRWNNRMKEEGFSIKIHEHGKLVRTLTSQPSLVTKDAKLAASNVDVIIITVPAFAHATYLEALKECIQEGTVLAGLPGQSGFEFAVRGILGSKAAKMTVVSFETLPWACRVTKFGTEAEVLGFKEQILGSLSPGIHINSPLDCLQRVMGPKPVLELRGHILGMTFMGVNGYIHPCIMYGQWKEWDGQGLDHKPLFYHGISQYGADLLSDVSNEIVDLAKRICRLQPEVDLSQVEHVHDWYKRCYPAEIDDDTSLYSSLRSNRAYDGLTHPVQIDADGHFHPNYQFRYLTEDIPYGLAVIKGVAQVAEMATPKIDQVLLWAQRCMNKEYLVDGRLQGNDVAETRSPQAFSITTMRDMLGLE